MIKSMTGYGRAESLSESGKIVLEIRSLNHRYLEVSLRLPAALSPLEMEMKKKINACFSRGKVEMTVRPDAVAALGKAAAPDLNFPLLKSYYSLLKRIKDEFGLQEEISLNMLSAFKDVFILPEESNPEEMWRKIEPLMDEAIAALMTMREREGAALARDLRERIAVIKRLLDDIGCRVPEVVAAYQKRLRERINELAGDTAIDETRLLQEVAIMAEKGDITEEIVRFRSHLDQFIDMLQSDGAVGRKVDFLIQEMGREVNTIGSKSSDGEISRNVIEIKSELARVREQVQNIE